MTRKRCVKLLMSSGAQKREVEEYVDALLPELGSYGNIIVGTLISAFIDAMEEGNKEIQEHCYARCCL